MSKKSYYYLFATVMLGVFLRFYQFPQTLSLGTDQGGAYILADRIINQGHILLVGPLTSLLQVNLLPPAYYYIVTVIYFLFRSEISVPLAFSFAGIVSIILIYFLGKNIFNTKSGLITALTYSVSQSMVWYGRDMWEPHLVPFFVILSLLFLFKAKNQTKLIFLHLSLFFFFLSFLYFSSILLLPVYYFCFTHIYKSVKSSARWPYFKTVLLFLLYGGLVYLPVIIFELSHSYPSLNYLSQVLQGKTEYVSFQSPNYLTSVTTHIFLFINSIFINVNIFQSLIIFIIFIGLVSYVTVKTKYNRFNLFVLLMFFIIAFLLSGLYSQKPAVYRLASLYPVFFFIDWCRYKSRKSNYFIFDYFYNNCIKYKISSR